ncbi:MAG TPA: hypothetical protein VFL70_10290 [Bacteroidia bacterium]|nr:hypothetical protein [Bacteroidia bacterium]
MSKSRKNHILIISLLSLLLLYSCNKEEPIPAYIHIDKIDLKTNYSIQGSNSHKIIDAWIYVDDQLVGAFELPCTVPVLYEGNHEVKILAGIKENGISDTRTVYPYYTSYQVNIFFGKGEISTITPVVNYLSDTQFIWLDDFEGAIPSICDSSITSDTMMQVTHIPSQVFENTGSAVVTLVNGVYYGYSCSGYTLPKTDQVFLELNYNCNTEFSIGLEGYSSSGNLNLKQTLITLRPVSTWNKVYINLTTAINEDPKSLKFKLFFSMKYNTSLSSSNLFIDNIKLVN